MRYETVTYIPLEPPHRLEDILLDLPGWVNAELVQHPRQLYVEVEASKTDVVEYLDRKFDIGIAYRFRKHVTLEIDQAEMPAFSHFNIVLYALEWGKAVKGTLVRPTCRSENCYVGSHTVPPLRIPAKRARRVGIARIHRPWEGGQASTLLVAAWLKRLFDAEGITGLEYEPCVFDRPEHAEADQEAPFAARISETVGLFADTVLRPRFMCVEHRILSSFHLIHRRLYREDLTASDFHVVDRVTAENETYRLLGPYPVVSRRALELLLKYKVKGLAYLTFFLKEKFLPLVLAERSG